MNIDAIRQIPLVDFLNHLGYQPTGRDSKGLWFYSPYRNERKPSFHVNPRKNLWFDFGAGRWRHLQSCGELTGETDFHQTGGVHRQKMQLPVEKPYKPVPFVEQPTFENVEISRLESPILLNYLADRGIPRDIAQRYCVQVDYTLHGKGTMPSVLRTMPTDMSCATRFSREHIRRKTSRISPTATHGATCLKAL